MVEAWTLFPFGSVWPLHVQIGNHLIQLGRVCIHIFISPHLLILAMFSATANVFWKFLIRWDRIQGCHKLPWRGCNRFHPSRAYQVRFFLDPTRISRIIWNSSVRTGIWRSSWARDISFILFGCLLCNCVRGTQAIIFVSGVPTSTICNFVYLYFVKLTHYLLLWFQYAYSIHRAPLSFRRGNR